MTKVNVAPLFGTTMPFIFPTILIVIVMADLLGFKKKILKIIGFEYFEIDADFDDEFISKGREDIYKEFEGVNYFFKKNFRVR